MTDAVTSSVKIALPLEATFRAFTEEIDAWYLKNRNTVFDLTSAPTIVLEPGVGGCLREAHDESSGEGPVLARVTVWEPPSRIELVDLRDTIIEVTFDEVEPGTLVTLVHRGLSALEADDPARRYGWVVVLPWFARYLAQKHTTDRRPA